MNISQKGIDLIKSFEGCHLKAYKDPIGILTIGVGHTGNVKEGQVITQAQADDILRKDLKRFVEGVEELVKVTISQSQFDALVSFAFNVGLGNLEKSTLLKLVNKRDFSGASLEFLKWDKADGKVLKGLTKRREAERKLFTTHVASKPVAVTKSAYKGNSLVDFLQSHNKKTDFASRKILSREMGMSHYSGNAEDNTKLLNILKTKWK
jgi:lysozyme